MPDGAFFGIITPTAYNILLVAAGFRIIVAKVFRSTESGYTRAIKCLFDDKEF